MSCPPPDEASRHVQASTMESDDCTGHGELDAVACSLPVMPTPTTGKLMMLSPRRSSMGSKPSRLAVASDFCSSPMHRSHSMNGSSSSGGGAEATIDLDGTEQGQPCNRGVAWQSRRPCERRRAGGLASGHELAADGGGSSGNHRRRGSSGTAPIWSRGGQICR